MFSLKHLLTVAILSAFTLVQAARAAEPSSVASFDERARKGEPLTVAFFGGSLSYGANSSDPLTTSYRGLISGYLAKKYPYTPLSFVDATLGGAGSLLGLFRIERDVLAHKPELVFLEFTMNDGATDSDPQTLAAYENLLRTLLRSGIAVQPVITTFKFFVNKPEALKLPRVEEHLKLAGAYQVPAANVHEKLHEALVSHKADIEVLWPFDGAHPDDPGYRLFFEIVRDQLEKNIAAKTVPTIPKETVFEALYPKIERRILVETPLPVGWTRQKTRRTSLWFDGLSSRWMTDVASAKVEKEVKPAPLELQFHGSLVALLGERDSIAAPFRVWIDGKPVAKPKAEPEDENLWKIDTSMFSPPKAGTGNLFSWVVLSKDLPDGDHTLRIEPVFDGTAPKAELRIESVCSAGR